MIFVKGTILAALFLGITAPAFIFQDAGAGNPDDVAELLPADTLFFAEIVRPPRLLKDWKEYVGSFCKADKKAEVCKKIEESVTGILNMIPEKLKKDLEKGLPSLQRLAFAFMVPDEDVPWAIIATSSDPAFFKTLVDEDLKVFSSDEKEHAGSKILVIRKAGELKSPEPVFIVVLGRRLVVTTHWETIISCIDRAAGKGRGDDLRKGRMYKEFAAATGEDPVFRAFGAMDWTKFMGGAGRFFSGRMTNHMMDQADAVLDFRKFSGGVVEATLRPGKIETRGRMFIDPPCRLYDALRFPPGPKECLSYIPKEAQFVVHGNLAGGKELWQRVEDLLKRADVVSTKSGSGSGDWLAAVTTKMKEEKGYNLPEIADCIGKEAALALVGDEAVPMAMGGGKSVVAVIHLADSGKAKDVFPKMIATKEYETRKDGETTFYSPSGEGSNPFVAITPTVIVIAGTDQLLKDALKAAADKTGFGTTLSDAAKKGSGLLALKHQVLLSLLTMTGAPIPPEFTESLDTDPWTTIVASSEKSYVQLSSVDNGLAFAAQSAIIAMPLAFGVLSTIRFGPGGSGSWPPKGEDAFVAAPPEPPALAADKLAAEVKTGIENLRSDDMSIRDSASDALKSLGKQAVPLLVEAAKKENDAEARARMIKILMDRRAFDAWPELLTRKADAFYSEFTKVAGDASNPYAGLGWWGQHESPDEQFSPWALEPSHVNLGILLALEHRDFLTMPKAMKHLGDKLESDKLEPGARRSLAILMAHLNSADGVEGLLKAVEKSEGEVRCYFQVALGWSPDPRAREAVIKGLKDGNKWIKRASFVAAERSTDPGLIPRLIELLKEKDHETRWNASYTLRVITDGVLSANVFLPDDDYNNAITAAQQWWEKNKDTYKITVRGSK